MQLNESRGSVIGSRHPRGLGCNVDSFGSSFKTFLDLYCIFSTLCPMFLRRLPINVLLLCYSLLFPDIAEAKQQCRLAQNVLAIPSTGTHNNVPTPTSNSGPDSTGSIATGTATTTGSGSSVTATPTPFNYGTTKIRGVNL